MHLCIMIVVSTLVYHCISRCALWSKHHHSKQPAPLWLPGVLVWPLPLGVDSALPAGYHCHHQGPRDSHMVSPHLHVCMINGEWTVSYQHMISIVRHDDTLMWWVPKCMHVRVKESWWSPANRMWAPLQGQWLHHYLLILYLPLIKGQVKYSDLLLHSNRTILTYCYTSSVSQDDQEGRPWCWCSARWVWTQPRAIAGEERRLCNAHSQWDGPLS